MSLYSYTWQLRSMHNYNNHADVIKYQLTQLNFLYSVAISIIARSRARYIAS